PFGPAGARLYRTGDLGRLRADGEILFLGRIDGQVKLRGFRIELGEIEDQLTQHPAVKQAAVVTREFKADDVRLVGYVVQHVGQSVSDADLRAHLKKTLPEYMVPAHLVKLERMPLTPSGKIDRKALPAPDVSAGLSDAFVAPRTDTERGLAEIWQQILSVGRVGATDDFFALGGHSLLASQLLSRVQQRFGAQLSFRKIFEAPTVEKLAALVDASKGKGTAVAQGLIPRRPPSTAVPLSVAQARLVLLEQMDPGTRAVHALCAKWKLIGPMNAEAMRKAFAALVARHEPLRSTLRVEAGGRQVVVVHPDRQIRLDELDVSALPPEAQDNRAIEVLRDYGMRPFDLDWEPPIRLMLMKRSEREHELLLGVHNFVWDGWSFDLFVRDLSTLYAAFAEGKPSPLPPLPVSYGDYAVWQQKFLDSEEANAQVAYWQEKLKEEIPPLELPTDSPRQGSRSSAGGNEALEMSGEIQDALTALAQREGTTLFAVVFAAFNVVLARHSGQRDFLVGVPVRARTRPELEDIIGPFTNNVLLRTQIGDGMTFLELLRKVKDQILDAFSNQEVPIERLGVKPPRVRAFFSLQDARGRPLTFGPMELRQVHTRPPNAANEMMLWTMQRKHGLLAMLNFSTDLYKPESMRRLLQHLQTILTELLKDPNRPVMRLPILPDEERRQLAGWADPGEEGAQTLWDELAARSSALAQAADGWARLVAQRGGRGKAVAVKLQPSPARAAAVLGVLRAGAVLAVAGNADLELREGDGPLPAGDPGPVPSGDAPAVRAGGAAVSQRTLARSFISLAGRAGVAALDSVWDGLDAGQDGWWMPAVLAAASGASTGGSKPTVVMAPAASMAEVHAQHPDAKLICTGHPSRKLSAALASRLAPAFAVLVPDAVGVPAAAGRVETRREGRSLFGRPLAGVPVRVLDAENEAVPINAPGRLVVADHPTSERVRFLADDTLEHLGWYDGLVQFRDKLVSTEKMAQAMAALPSVAGAVVRRMEDRDGEERLVAYIAARPGEMFTETELRSVARKAAGVAPQIFVELESLPYTAKGAVDDDRLPYP
ncbi:MAG TPA: condensation domain-containing protein, partial [Myxococcales bacterium]|nr:condensation domain-containing protein [Myxococcales bacterium]